MPRRLRHCWLILIGRIPIQYSPERMEFDMALENFTAATVDLQAAANALIAKASTDATARADLETQLAGIDATATAAIKTVTDSINAVLNPPQSQSDQTA